MSRSTSRTPPIDAPNREASGSYGAVRHVPPPARRTESDPVLGEVIDGRFTIERLIARGAMGAVYLARQKRLDRHVAVKILDRTSTADEPTILVERFHREAAVLARLQHPNTVRVFDAGEWKGRLYLVMEYVDGWSLKRLQQGGPVPAARVVDIAVQMCDALHEAHTLGLIHRDLKPANVLITRMAGALDVVKVVDFGLAKDCFSRTELTQDGQVLGTPMYMAPEQIRDEACDGRADLYAVGVLMYGALLGKHPFELGPATQVMMAHLEKPVPTFAEAAPGLSLPPILEWTVHTALAKRVQDRFASVQELKKALHLCAQALREPGAVVPIPELRDGVVFPVAPPPQEDETRVPLRRAALVVALASATAMGIGTMLAGAL